MPKRYQNVGFTSDKSVFIDVQSQSTSEATFTASKVQAAVTGGRVPMVKGSVALRTDSQAVVCGSECPTSVTESFELKFSVKAGAENLSALRAEVNRLFDAAQADFALTQGLVPPVYAAFGAE